MLAHSFMQGRAFNTQLTEVSRVLLITRDRNNLIVINYHVDTTANATVWAGGFYRTILAHKILITESIKPGLRQSPPYKSVRKN